MTEHSNKIGGSSAARAIACPGSVPLAAKMPEGPPSEYADEGTALHTVMERLMLDPELAPESFVGQAITVRADEETGEAVTVTVTQDHLDEMILPALDAFDEIAASLEDEESKTWLDFDVERKVEFGRPLVGCFGTADVLGVAGNVGLVLDWKFGRGVQVKAEGNVQGRFYAAAALESYAPFENVEEVVVAIVQPAFASGDNPGYSIERVSLEDLGKLRGQLETALHQSMKQPPLLSLGDHCRWCPAKPVCPLMHDTAVDMLDRDALGKAKKGEVNFEHLAEDLALADELEGYIKAVRTFAHQQMEAGEKVPGWKLVAKRAIRRWVNEDKLYAWAKSHRSVKVLFPRKAITVAAAEKAIKGDLPDELIHATSSGTTLAPESDKRPAVTTVGDLAKVAKRVALG